MKRAADVKRCSSCWRTKPLAQFHVKRAAADGRVPHCKACRRALRGEEHRVLQASLRAARHLREELDGLAD